MRGSCTLEEDVCAEDQGEFSEREEVGIVSSPAGDEGSELAGPQLRVSLASCVGTVDGAESRHVEPFS